MSALAPEDHVEHNDRNEIFEIVENLDPQTDRGVFSTTGCQQVEQSHLIIIQPAQTSR